MTRIALLFSFLLSVQAMAQDTPFRRGVNLTNWFQAPSAGQIDFDRYSRQDFERIRNLGADVIRLPINLHHMTGGAPDYALDSRFLAYLDQAVDWAESLDLHLILDNHTFDPSANTDPAVRGVLLKVWPQMAAHFRERSERLYYEVLNEPHGIDDATWNDIQREVVAAIRAVDDRHTIIVGPAGWNSYNNLAAMPEYADDNLIYTFHFYDPFLFTHQGASWVQPSMVELEGIPFPHDAAEMPPLPASLQGTWVGSAHANYANEGTVARVRELLDIALAFRAERGVPIFLGELGVLMNNSDPQDRVTWYREVREYLEANDVAWTTWDYHHGFGLFEPGSAGRFEHDLNVPLLEALGFNVPPQSAFVPKADTVGFTLYQDRAGEGIAVYGQTSGALEWTSTAGVYQGTRSIRWRGARQFDAAGFAFEGWRDLGFLVANGYALDLAVRCDRQDTVLGLRFLDTDTADPADRPWRMGVTLEAADLDCDGQWQHLHLPMADLEEQGAWEEGAWYPPQGEFDWSRVDRFEITSETDHPPNAALGFDAIAVTRQPAGPPSLSNAAGLNGLFYDPAAPGHGFDFNVLESGMVVFYYGHTSGGERLWLISDTWDGGIEFDTPLALDFYELPDGQFGAPGASGLAPWGTITLTMHGCNTALAQFDGVDGTLQMSLARLAGVPGESCDVE